MEQRILVIVAHGSSSASSKKATSLFTSQLQIKGYSKIVGFLEKEKPSFEEALENATTQASKILVLPLLLFPARHYKTDVRAAIERTTTRHPGLSIQLLDVLGRGPDLSALLQANAEAALTSMGPRPHGIALVVPGRGASDAKARDEFLKTIRHLQAASSLWALVAPCFHSFAEPSPEQALERARTAGFRTLILQPCLIFPGGIFNGMKRQALDWARRFPEIRVGVGRPLCEAARWLDLISFRIREAEGS